MVMHMALTISSNPSYQPGALQIPPAEAFLTPSVSLDIQQAQQPPSIINRLTTAATEWQTVSSHLFVKVELPPVSHVKVARLWRQPQSFRQAFDDDVELFEAARYATALYDGLQGQ